MFLKSLTLKGFKSFAETTTLEFEPGVTVVVGPNGSGKSNIVDAVAWVLGAQGPRTMRSTKMDDVVFAGSAKRPALGRAEVSLTIDNSAGLLPIEFTEVTLTRTLFRSSGESEYAINGVPCRLLDVQELLSDTGVGRQQHVIVSQGQLDAVLNSRPEDRRTVIEEAAGVLKFRRRREKAQRRLDATEANTVRLHDLLREVRRQLRPLQRQAEAARRHGDLANELSALRLHVAGRRLEALEARAMSAAARREGAAASEEEVKGDLARLDAEVESGEREMAAVDAAGLSEAVARIEALRQRGRGLAAVVAERRRSLERSRSALVDESLVASLESESAAITVELDQVEDAARGLAPRADDLDRAEAELAAARRNLGGPPAATAPAGLAAEVRGELSALRTAVSRSREEVEALAARETELERRAPALDEQAALVRAGLAGAEGAERRLADAAAEADSRRQAAHSELTEAEDHLRSAEARHQAAMARADALAQALDDARSRAGAESVSGVAGVVGTLLDMVEVDEGWEAAFEAAADHALAAVVVDGPEAARRAVERLQETGTTGAVVILGGRRPPADLPLLGEPLRPHVRSAHAGVDALLDVLMAGVVTVLGGWRQALEVAAAHPHVVAVTPEGDRFTAGSAKVGASGRGATGAALEEATRAVEEAAVLRAAAEERLATARRASREAVEAAARASAALDRHDDQVAADAAVLQELEVERRDLAAALALVRSDLRRTRERLVPDEARMADLEGRLPDLEADEAAYGRREEDRRSVARELDERASGLLAVRRQLEVEAAQLETRALHLSERKRRVEERLSRHAAEREQAERRRIELDAAAAASRRLAAVVEEVLARLDSEAAARTEARRRQADALGQAARRLEALRAERARAERRLGEVREEGRRAELDEAEARMRVEAAVEALQRELDSEPGATRAAPCPPLPPATTAAERVRELERELRVLGPVNPLALEEFTALEERHSFLEAQLDDVRASRRDLAKIIRAVDAEIVQVFSAAYADVAENFVRLFETLFPGGQGQLRLTDPDNLLETGIEIEVRPPGKTLRKLSLLSGGERSLTALAFLFAVFRSRPSPFYLMDEVEAALDDVNLHRFLDLVGEFRREAQLLVVSHQKRTMEAADCLYGVTMQPGGSSKVVSERVVAPT